MRGLKYDANPALQALQSIFGVIMPINADDAFLGFIKTAEQIDDSGLTATGRSNQRDGLARVDLQGKISQDRLAIFVVEAHMVKLDLTTDRTGCKANPVDPVHPAECRSV